MAFRTNKTPVLQEKTASGSVASFNTALAMPLTSCNIAVNAWQEGSGTPSPSNVRPLHAFSSGTLNKTGKNLFDLSKYLTDNNISYTRDGDWFIFNISSALYNNKFSIPLNYYSCTLILDNERTIATNVNLRVYKQGTAVAQGTTLENKNIDSVGFNYSTTGQVCCKAQVELGSSATSYEPYNGNTYTFTFGQEVYGAEVDVVNGVAHVTQVKEILRGSYFSTYSASIQCAIGGKPVGWLPWLKQTGGSCVMLSHGLPTTRSDIGNISNGCFIGDTTGGNQEVMFIKFAGYSSLEGVQAFIEEQYNLNNPVEVVYKLATPFDIQLTPTQIETLIGNNTIFADTGDVDLTFNDLDIAKRGSFREVFKLP